MYTLYQSKLRLKCCGRQKRAPDTYLTKTSSLNTEDPTCVRLPTSELSWRTGIPLRESRKGINPKVKIGTHADSAKQKPENNLHLQHSG